MINLNVFRYLYQKEARLRRAASNPRVPPQGGPRGSKPARSPPKSGYLQLYKELLQTTKTCRTETNRTFSDTSLQRPEIPEKEWTKNFASPECGAKIGNQKVNLFEQGETFPMATMQCSTFKTLFVGIN